MSISDIYYVGGAFNIHLSRDSHFIRVNWQPINNNNYNYKPRPICSYENLQNIMHIYLFIIYRIKKLTCINYKYSAFKIKQINITETTKLIINNNRNNPLP